MLQEVPVGHKSLSDYTHVVGKELTERIRELAKPLEGQRVLHVSATAFGGGVSEILYTIVPLMRDVGLDAHWHVIFGKEEFFNATKLLHNSLQGAEETLTDEQWEVFDEINEINAEGLQGEWDTIIVHDPQPIGLRRGAEAKSRNWIWRCHIDLSEPNPAPIARLQPMIEEYDATVWHLPTYVPSGIDMNGGVRIIPPAIDPLSPKNMAFSPDDAAFVCNQFGIDVDRPLITQVSRFDPWKDPMGVIDAYRDVTKEVPERAARPRRLDGDRRPRGLGLLPEDLRIRRRRPRHQDPQQPQQRRRDRGQRLPVAVRRLPAEVDPRGLRPDRHRGALEGPPDGRRQRRRHPPADRGRRRRLPGRLAGRVRRSAGSRSSPTPSSASASGAPARNTPAASSSLPACCATGSS